MRQSLFSNGPILGLAMAVLSTGLVRAQDVTPSGDPRPLRAVRLLEATDTRPVARTFFGRVVPRETASLSFEVGGHLIKIAAREGAYIEAGTVVARLDPDPFERTVERAELTLAQAERDAERAATLAARDVATGVAVEDARTARDLAAVALRDARAAREDTTLAAPFDGLVAERLAAEYINVEPGQPILAMHDLSEVRVEIEVPERVLLQAGDVDALRFHGSLPDGATTPLTLAEFEPQTGRVGQSFRVSLTVPEEAARDLIPGASMSVDVLLPVRDAAKVLPASAILGRTNRGFEVMLFDPDPTAPGEGKVTPVEITVTSPDGVTLSVEGLPEGAAIVATGGHLLKPGERVRRYDGLTSEEP